MMRITSVVALFPDLAQTELVSWVERGWVRPEGTEPDWTFAEIDVARVRLIYDFGRTMAVPEETIQDWVVGTIRSLARSHGNGLAGALASTAASGGPQADDITVMDLRVL